MTELNPDQRTLVGRLFERAAELPPPQRAEFLERECADADVRQAVALLLEHADHEAPLGRAAIASVAAATARETDPDERLIGTHVGPYKVDIEHGMPAGTIGWSMTMSGSATWLRAVIRSPRAPQTHGSASSGKTPASGAACPAEQNHLCETSRPCWPSNVALAGMMSLLILLVSTHVGGPPKTNRAGAELDGHSVGSATGGILG